MHKQMVLVVMVGLVGCTLAASARGADAEKKKVLFFTKSTTYEHDVVKHKGDQPALAEKVLQELGEKHAFEVTCTKDGSLFTPENLVAYDAFAFETQGAIGTVGTVKDDGVPMSLEGKEALLKAIEGGKGFIGFHCASDTFHSPKPKEGEELKIDPYIQMLGGEFLTHGAQQKATMKVVDKNFPGIKDLEDFGFQEEWYALKYFSPDDHVILVMDTKGMTGDMYQRPPYPATWARMQGKGRVFFTSMGHREDVWTNPTFQQVAVAGLDWILGRTEAEVKPNIKEVTPDPEPPVKAEVKK